LKERKIEDCSKIDITEYTNITGNAIEKSEDTNECFGGILITNDLGNIVCKNTLDIRTNLCF